MVRATMKLSEDTSTHSCDDVSTAEQRSRLDLFNAARPIPIAAALGILLTAVLIGLVVGVPPSQTVSAAQVGQDRQVARGSVTVDGSQVLRSFAAEEMSLNLNFFLDDQEMLNPATPLASAVSTMGTKVLRFPGGEKSDNYLWSVPPYTAPDPHFAVTGDRSCVPTYRQWGPLGGYTTDYLRPIDATLDFDEFMDLVAATGSEAFITVNGDAHRYKGDCPTVTLETLVANAAEWVRYANVTNNMGIEYWMVGNETWNASGHDRGSVPSPTEAAADFVAIASAMHAVDPTITIIANTRHGAWIDELIAYPGALELIDAIGISNYPISGMSGGYDSYRHQLIDLSWQIRRLLPTVQRHDLPIVVYEYLPIDFGGGWSSVNDLGHALATFQMLGDQLTFPEVSMASIWNTRWFRQAQNGFDYATGSETLFDTLKIDGSLAPTGQAISLWGTHALDDLLFTTTTQFTNVYATTSTDGADTTIFVINRDTQPIELDINTYHLPGMQGQFSVASTTLSGAGQADRYPTLSDNTADVVVDGQTLKVPLAPTSVTALRIDGATTRTMTASVATRCLGDDGRFDVSITNISGVARQAFVSITGLPERSLTVAAGATETVTVTGRRDGDYTTIVSGDGIAVLTSKDRIACDPTLAGSDGLVISDCLAGNGRIKVALRNDYSSTGNFAVRLAPMATRLRTLQPWATDSITITGRSDGDYPLTVTRNGESVLSVTVPVDCDPDPTEEVSVSHGCLSGNGRVTVALGNLGAGTALYSVMFGSLAPRLRTLAPLGISQVTITGRPDGEHPLVIRRDGVEIWSEDITITCDAAPGDDISTSVEAVCLVGNGRVDVRISNDSASASTFTVTFGQLAPRTATVEAGTQRTFTVTGRPDGSLGIRIDRDGAMLSFTFVTIDCDP